jgi:hypothetical protein
LAGRIFLLSPANCSGRRAQQLLAPGASSVLAVELRSRRGANLGDVFAFVSGLYFRGKLTYARRYASPPDEGGADVGGVHIITSNAGLRDPDTRIGEATLRRFATDEVHVDNDRYTRPLERSASALALDIGPRCDVVLLGSIATPKYVDVLLGIFGARLKFPIEFVGRGDMSRGGLLLRKVTEGVELEYVSVVGAARRGPRPPRNAPS